MRDFFVLGLQRSGTHYLRCAIERNTDLTYREIGWKHTMSDLPDDVFKVAITKSPYNWAKSICTRQRVDLLTKYKQYKLMSPGEQYRGINIPNLLRLWKDWNRFWLSREILFLKYETLLHDPIWPFKQIGQITGCNVTLPPDMHFHRPGMIITPERRAEYLKHPTADDPFVRLINKHVDHDLITRLGYPNGW